MGGSTVLILTRVTRPRHNSIRVGGPLLTNGLQLRLALQA